jgi:hypothetical protein
MDFIDVGKDQPGHAEPNQDFIDVAKDPAPGLKPRDSKAHEHPYQCPLASFGPLPNEAVKKIQSMSESSMYPFLDLVADRLRHRIEFEFDDKYIHRIHPSRVSSFKFPSFDYGPVFARCFLAFARNEVLTERQVGRVWYRDDDWKKCKVPR